MVRSVPSSEGVFWEQHPSTVVSDVTSDLAWSHRSPSTSKESVDEVSGVFGGPAVFSCSKLFLFPHICCAFQIFLLSYSRHSCTGWWIPATLGTRFWLSIWPGDRNQPQRGEASFMLAILGSVMWLLCENVDQAVSLIQHPWCCGRTCNTQVCFTAPAVVGRVGESCLNSFQIELRKEFICCCVWGFSWLLWFLTLSLFLKAETAYQWTFHTRPGAPCVRYWCCGRKGGMACWYQSWWVAFALSSAFILVA